MKGLLDKVLLEDERGVLVIERSIKPYRLLGEIAFGSVLEIGYGAGITHAALEENNNVYSIEVVDNRYGDQKLQELEDFIAENGGSAWDCIIFDLHIDDDLFEKHFDWMRTRCDRLIATGLGRCPTQDGLVLRGDTIDGRSFTVWDWRVPDV